MIAYFESMSSNRLTFMGLILVLVIFAIDYITGSELSVLVFYIIPIFLISWFAGRSRGLLVSAASAVAWVAADILTRHAYSPLIAFGNLLVKFSVFLLLAFIVSTLRMALIRETDLNNRLRINIHGLQSANKELEAFNYSVSHDLRNPLIAIGGFVRRLQKTQAAALDLNARETLDIIERNSQKMLQLIDGLLVFSRSGRQKIKTSLIDMQKLAKEVCNELSEMTPERSVRLTVASLPPAYGDELLVRQVYYNLLSNAIKFTRQKVEAVIEVGGSTEGDEHIYSVRDNGIGFDMQHKEELFDTFYRLHKAGEFEGSGLGLAIVQRIIERHGGRVWGEGTENAGATFYFSLPVRKRDDETTTISNNCTDSVIQN